MNKLCVSMSVILALGLTPALAGKDKNKFITIDDVRDAERAGRKALREERALERYEEGIERLEGRLEGASDEQRQRIENIIESVTERFEAKWGELPDDPPPPPPDPDPDPEPTVLFKDDFNRNAGQGLGNGWETSQGGRAQCIGCDDARPLLDSNGNPVLNPDGTPIIIPAQGVLGLQQTEQTANEPLPGFAIHSTDLAGTNYESFTLSYDYATSVSSSNSMLRVSWSDDGERWYSGIPSGGHTIEGGDLTVSPDWSHNSFTIQNQDYDSLHIKFQAEGDPWVFVDNVELVGNSEPFVGY
jgi:hypothetical protein